MNWEEFDNMKEKLIEGGHDCDVMSSGELMYHMLYSDLISTIENGSFKERRDKDTIMSLFLSSESAKTYYNKNHLEWVLGLKGDRDNIYQSIIDVYTLMFDLALAQNKNLLNGKIVISTDKKSVIVKTNKNYNDEKDKSDLIKVFSRYTEDFTLFLPYFVNLAFEENMLKNLSQLERELQMDRFAEIYSESNENGNDLSEKGVSLFLRENILRTFLEKPSEITRIRKKI